MQWRVPQGICSFDVDPTPSNYSASPAAFYAQLDDNEEIQIKYQVVGKGGIKGKWSSLGAVSVAKHPTALAANATLNTVHAVVPSHALLAGDTFDLKVRSRFMVYLKTVEVQVKVGDGLKILYKAGFPAVATQPNGQSVFEQAQIDGDDNKAYAVLAGRKDGKQPETKAGTEATDEPLFTLRIMVLRTIEHGGSANVQITKLEGVADLKEQTLASESTGALLSRAGRVLDNAVQVHFITDQVKGIFAYANGPSEILNKAALTADAIRTPIVVESVFFSGSIANADPTACASTRTEQIGAAITDGSCNAILGGNETEGARDATINVTSLNFSRSVHFRVHQMIPDSVRVFLDRPLLRPIAGWFQDSCDSNQLEYQRALVSVTATFSDGGPASSRLLVAPTNFTFVDVTSVARLASSCH